MWSRTHRRANCLLYPLPLRRGGHSLMAPVATCFYIREDHVLPQLCKTPLHCLWCACYQFNRFRPLTQHVSFTSLPCILSKSLILASLRSLFRYQHWLHGLQPALSQPYLTCLTMRLPHNLSLPLYMAPSFSFSPHPLHPAAHTHIRVTTFKITTHRLAYSPLLLCNFEHSHTIFPQFQQCMMSSGHSFPFQVTYVT